MSVPYFYKNNNSRFLSLEGEDTSEFLQNLITNDVSKVYNDNIIYSCLLTPQGKFLCDFFIFKLGKKFILEVHSLFYDDFFKKLKMYKLRSKIQIYEISNYHSYSVFGKIEKDDNSIILTIDPRNKHIGYKLIQESSNPKSLKFFDVIDEKKYHEILIKNTVPLSHYDLEVNKSLLLENNFENINSISWDKGCYVGQEITARMKYRSLLKKKLYPLEIISGKISLNDKVIENNLNFGEVISKANNYIFCILKIELAEEKIKENSTIKINDQTLLKFL
mgnify:CR=1 FL=1